MTPLTAILDLILENGAALIRYTVRIVVVVKLVLIRQVPPGTGRMRRSSECLHISHIGERQVKYLIAVAFLAFVVFLICMAPFVLPISAVALIAIKIVRQIGK